MTTPPATGSALEAIKDLIKDDSTREMAKTIYEDAATRALENTGTLPKDRRIRELEGLVRDSLFLLKQFKPAAQPLDGLEPTRTHDGDR